MMGTANLVDLDKFYRCQNTFVNLSRDLYYRAKKRIKNNIKVLHLKHNLKTAPFVK
jgi:hypothetical protein